MKTKGHQPIKEPNFYLPTLDAEGTVHKPKERRKQQATKSWEEPEQNR